MPLVLLSGYPSSGKTHRSQQIVDFFASKIADAHEPRVKRLKVHHIDDQRLGLSRDVYAAARPEKDARATFSSAIKRLLTQDAVVVADGMNYIKGFRYQLYCEAKAVQTPNCVVHVGTPVTKCREFNEAALRDKTGGYEPEIFENLIYRFEEPNGMARWDSPLFIVPFEDDTPDLTAIWDAMIGDGAKAKAIKPNAATVLPPAAEQNYLYELDKATSEIIASVVAWQADHPHEIGGGPKLDDIGQVVLLPASTPSLPQLQRLRRQFIALNRQHSVGKNRVRELFVDYLNDSFQSRDVG